MTRARDVLAIRKTSEKIDKLEIEMRKTSAIAKLGLTLSALLTLGLLFWQCFGPGL